MCIRDRYQRRVRAGIERPAIVSALPTMTGHTYVLDLGANVDSSAAHLVQFAVMGSVLAELVDGKPNPTVGLLNIGSEEIKGNERVKDCLLYTSDAADEEDSVDLGGRRPI
eukprot:TRINITY_DN36673_c0_g1_i1.p1 TRINITY_DN36673_c0_g1~~TRINITY_DN36673_c0_g1_i1.p1  ORF type:complete len:111 (-),score=22.65 TRINITY_DN36673_c0_g1_i1:8-340(-)